VVLDRVGVPVALVTGIKLRVRPARVVVRGVPAKKAMKGIRVTMVYPV
jgi:hypothetical protein